MTYSLRPTTTSPELIKFLSKEGHKKFLNRPIAKESFAVLRDDTLLTVLPSHRFVEGLTMPDMFKIARELPIFQATASLDTRVLTRAFRMLGGVYGKRIIHLPFLCEGIPRLLEQTHPFVEMGSFEKESFLKSRRWLARQHAHWAEFQFFFQKFSFDRDKDIVAFYVRNAAKRLQLTLAEVSQQLESLRPGGIVSHVAVLRYKNTLAAICFVGKDDQGDLVLVNNAMRSEFVDKTPGNALLFHLLCYVKEKHLARRVHFRAIFPGTKTSYKLNWCEHSYHTYLQLIE